MRVVAIFLMGITVGIAGAIAFRPAPPPAVAPRGALETASVGTSSPDASVHRSIVALGTLEPRDGVVQVGSPLIGTRIQKVHVQEGQTVQAGDVLIELDPAAAIAEHALALSQQAEGLERQQTEIGIAKERIAAAELAVQQGNDGRQLELDAQKSRINVAAAKQKQAAKDVERVEELRKLAEPLATAQQVEQQKVVLEAAAAEHEAVQVAYKRLEQALTFQQQTAAAELRAAKQTLAVAEKGTGLESLKHRVELAAIHKEQTKIVAPSAGVVLGISAHPGEIIAQQPLLQLADLDHLICTAEVEAGDVPLIEADHKALVRSRAFQDTTLDGTVDRVGNQVSQATLRPLDPRKPVDRNVTKVVVLIDSKKAARLMNTSGKDRRAAMVGLQVEVEFPLGK